MNKILLILGLLPLLACGHSKQETEQKTAAPTAANTNTPTTATSQAKDTPEVQEMLALFQQQPHRIELNGCEMLYNGKPFRVGMTIKELEGVFGPPSMINRSKYVWQQQGLVFSTDPQETGGKHTALDIYIYI